MKENEVNAITEDEFLQFRNGNERAFKRIFNCYHKRLFYYIYGFTKSFHDSEEIVQETFIALSANKTNIHDNSGIYPYLFVVAKRLMISNFRKKVVHAKYKNYLSISWNESSCNTQEELAVKDLHETLEQFIKQLPEKEQRVYRLNKLEGKSYDEIAAEFGISKNTVKNQLIAASKKIKWKLEKIAIVIILMISNI